ncbi:hypothetical protein BpHYR1_017278 [Brachionus plicatilis]|uniref:Winged helix-turn-helix domain-containing protein n=1 Tax=Brachionus plicatilis TaxID=10195 RepID=A0A3M7PAM5_BRAPC|nr:hypothetical protein BpHYR1_017278 [Brachionus plicatilis]
MEYIVLEPLVSKNTGLNLSIIERKTKITAEEEKLILHEAEGSFTGFIVKKPMPLLIQESLLNFRKSDLSFKLKVLMKHLTLAQEQQEQRVLTFWFINADKKEHLNCSNMFFRNLFKQDFPRDYFSFLLRIMQIIKVVKSISRVKVEIEKIGSPKPLGSQFLSIAHKITSSVMHLKSELIEEIGQKDPKQFEMIISGKILEFLERSFPNPMSIEELANLTQTDLELVYKLLCNLLERDLVKFYDDGASWVRKFAHVHDQHDFYEVQQQPVLPDNQKPTIAIITVNYYEKLAVDAMMTDKITFYRRKPEGESNVYTIGLIGNHRVVSTKLPLLNKDSRSAKITSGNTTTRLLGIFDQIEHVFLIGCAGAVPNYSDFSRHLRRGDIVVSVPDLSSTSEEDFIYGQFEITKNQNGFQYSTKSWLPRSPDLYRIVQTIQKSYDPQSQQMYPWETYINEGVETLTSKELDCRRPVEDKLLFTFDDKNVIEVEHPTDSSGSFNRREYGYPVLKFGRIASGEALTKNDGLRNALSEENGILCFDTGMDQVMESIEGNRKESYIIIRSISDYSDGTTTKEWQPYSAVCAAAFAKTIINALPVAN